MPHITAAQVEARLHTALAPTQLVVHDDSAAHAGHAGAREGSHLRVEIESASFAGLSRPARHRLVYDALSDWMPHGIHALTLSVRAPGEA